MPRVKRTPKARLDALEIWHAIAPFSTRSADAFLERLKKESELIGRMPGIGTARDELSPGLRSVPMGTFIIYFRRKGNLVEVVRVLHAARDAKKAFGQ